MDADRVKRADAHLAIAQFRFKQAMKTAEQPDASASLPAVTVESTTHFCNALEAVLRQNTPANIQTCKRWIVQHVTPSNSRTAVLGEYLVAVSRSIVVDQNAKTKRAARNRLDVLLVVSDVLHADRFHGRNHGKDAWVARQLKPYIEDLVELAALLIDGKDTAHEKKLKAILNFWAASQCISADAYRSIRERFAEGLLVAQGGTPVRKRTYALPERFGDRNAPWHEQPASYMVDCLIEHPDRPITTSSIRALRPERRQPSEHVRGLLEEYFENIDLKYMPTGDNPTGETKKYKLWLDPMGQLVKQDKTTGETKTVYNGYGWSVKFCQDMRKDKVPSRIAEKRKILRENIRLREEKQREETLRKRNRPSLSPSPPRRRRRYSSSASDRESDDYRSRSPDSDRERQHDGCRQPSRDDNTTYNRPSLFDNPQDIGQGRQPLQWNTSQNSHPRANRNTHRGAGNNGNATEVQGVQPPPPPPGQGQYPVSFAPQFRPQPPRYQEPSPPNPADFNRSAFTQGVIWVAGTPGVRLPITPEEYNKNPAFYNRGDYGGQWEGGSRGGPGGGFRGGYGRGFQGNTGGGFQGRPGGGFQGRGGNRGGNNRGQWTGRRRG